MFLVVSTHLWTIAQLEHLPPKWGCMKHEIKHVWSEDTPKNGSFRQASPKRYLNQRILRLAGSESQTQKIHNLTLPSLKWQSTFLWSKLSVLAPSDTNAQKNCSWSQFQENQIQWYNIDSSRMEIARHQGELSIRVFHPPELVSHFCGRYLPKLASKG